MTVLRAAESTLKTDTGRQRRENEDSAFMQAPLFVVADGMGGAQAGEVASRIAVEAFEAGLADSGSPEEQLADRVREANRQIYERSRAEHGREGMGTTLTAAYLDDAYAGHRLLGRERVEGFVGARAARAAFRGEQLYEHGRGLSGEERRPANRSFRIAAFSGKHRDILEATQGADSEFTENVQAQQRQGQ